MIYTLHVLKYTNVRFNMPVNSCTKQKKKTTTHFIISALLTAWNLKMKYIDKYMFLKYLEELRISYTIIADFFFCLNKFFIGFFVRKYVYFAIISLVFYSYNWRYFCLQTSQNIIKMCQNKTISY